MNKTVILLGGSNSVIKNGLQKGLKESIETLNDNGGGGLEFYNLALGSTTCIQSLYELKRAKNQQIFKNAKLIITESNINDSSKHHLQKCPLKVIFRNLTWYYKELYFLQKPILVLLLPLPENFYSHSRKINDFHKKLCIQFGFNIIDVQAYADETNLLNFLTQKDPAHIQARIMREFGKNIIKNIKHFKQSKKLKGKNDNPKFIILSPKDMCLEFKNLQAKRMRNSMYDELAYELTQQTSLTILPNLKGYKIIALHSFTSFDFNHFCFIFLKNKKQIIQKEMAMSNCLADLSSDFIIDDESFLSLNCAKKADIVEKHELVSGEFYHFDSLNLISIFLAKENQTKSNFKLQKSTLKIPKKYNFNHLIPPIDIYKEIVDESVLNKPYLSQKLGQALINAYKNWHKGALLKFFLYEVWQIKREFQAKKTEKQD